MLGKARYLLLEEAIKHHFLKRGTGQEFVESTDVGCQAGGFAKSVSQEGCGFWGGGQGICRPGGQGHQWDRPLQSDCCLLENLLQCKVTLVSKLHRKEQYAPLVYCTQPPCPNDDSFSIS